MDDAVKGPSQDTAKAAKKYNLVQKQDARAPKISRMETMPLVRDFRKSTSMPLKSEESPFLSEMKALPSEKSNEPTEFPVAR